MEDVKKKKFKKRYWLVVYLVVLVVVALLFLHKPSYFKPSKVAGSREVSTYLTHELSPRFYNGVQLREPFSLVVHQNRLNDAIARSGWLKESDGNGFSTPMVFFVKDRIVLVTSKTVMGAELVVIIESEASIDKKGLLNLDVTRVKVGAVTVTFIAKMMAKRKYAQSLAETSIDMEDLGVRIAASFLGAEPFEPVFEVEDDKVRIKGITISQGKLLIQFVPVFEEQ